MQSNQTLEEVKFVLSCRSKYRFERKLLSVLIHGHFLRNLHYEEKVQAGLYACRLAGGDCDYWYFGGIAPACSSAITLSNSRWLYTIIGVDHNSGQVKNSSN